MLVRLKLMGVLKDKTPAAGQLEFAEHFVRVTLLNGENPVGVPESLRDGVHKNHDLLGRSLRIGFLKTLYDLFLFFRIRLTCGQKCGRGAQGGASRANTKQRDTK